ncbi:MAG: tetraacyldisaccharide 4'-kinase, partial [Mariprofundaceae bacterium]|nr:tetraacyldisaccharide 4'-kinase [Mariprofundaceae bacterium]
MVHQFFERLWWKKSKPYLIFRIFSLIYARLATFDQQKRLAQASTSPLPLISVGNITVGGSGKTPFVLWLADVLRQHGYSPVLLCRGDGGKKTDPQWVTASSLASDVGDEAALLYRLSGCPVLSGKDRVLASQMAAEKGDIIILDDGFQYRQLQRTCDIVLIPSEGVGNGYLLPAGPLRESISVLNRADILVRSGSKQATTALSRQQEWSWSTQSKVIRDWNQTTPDTLQAPKNIHAISSIARPQRFINDLQTLGFNISTHQAFADHFAYQQRDVDKLHHHATTIVTTAKDAVKLLPLWKAEQPLWVLEQQAHAEQGLIEEILAHLT